MSNTDGQRPAHLPGPFPVARKNRPTIETIVETSIYSLDLDRMEDFYVSIMNFPVIAKETGRHVFFMAGPGSVLLIFHPEATRHGHLLPSHGTTGAGHVAFGVKEELLDVWRSHLAAHQIAIEKEQSWPKGGHSIYFRDPAGNSIELITPKVWGTPNGW
jgi:catechol 2,3-dioxygenase-like lactoylglutathione lyase family enzyme